MSEGRGQPPIGEDPVPGKATDPRLYRPRSVEVVAGDGGRPREVAGLPVAAVREEWLVENGWWTGRPLRRRYFEIVLADGRDLVVFRELETERWYSQRA